MDKDSAKKLIRETFENPFEKDRFIRFVKNLLNHVEEKPFANQGTYIRHAFKDHIQKYERPCKYIDPAGKQVDVLIVHLQKGTSLERARSLQRNFIAWYLNGGRGDKLRDAALVAFVAPNQEDWRFSLVKMDYRLDDSGEKIKIQKRITPARRFSYLVGKNENSHTAQSRLVHHLEDDDHDPTLTDLEDAFSIEKVTKEFFEEYRELFLKVKEALDAQVAKNQKMKKDFEANGVDTVNFAKKLLGQIVFLYFLQKKGWFGVARDNDWNTGPKDFLRKLFKKEIGSYENFFNDVLEYLFYDALRLERPEDFYGKLNCKIPFLNGGLFDPINDYSWVSTDILLPNELFSNSIKTSKGDTGTGILDVFDRYNFTVREDEPLEKEVAIDPEMLGKVYEKFNAIRTDNYEEYLKALKGSKKGGETKFNRDYGVYYTPPWVVTYMCQESLVHYLDTMVNIGPTPMVPGKASQPKLFGKSDPEQTGLEVPGRREIVKKEDLETFIRLAEMVVEHESRVARKGRETDKYSFKLPESIRKNAQALDDALAHIRVCDPAVGSGAFLVGMMNEIVRARNALTSYLNDEAERTPYDFKRHAIHDCLYGADIDPGAVEICKLRLWLSLVVDEEDIKYIKPLPNLDYKIVAANSLLKGDQRDWLKQSALEELEALKEKVFDETRPGKKKEIRDQVNSLIQNVQDGNHGADLEIHFSEVFHNPKGFDVVIGNPPYVQKTLDKKFKKYLKDTYHHGNTDLYTWFIERGIGLLKENGVFTFITSNKWLRANYGKGLRSFLAKSTHLRELIDFGDLPIFENATTYPSVLITQKQAPERQNFVFAPVKRLDFPSLKEEISTVGLKLDRRSFNGENWTLAKPDEVALIEKLKQRGVPLGKYVEGKIYRGILTGLNKAFVIDRPTRDQLIAQDPKSAELIKPFLLGREIKRYQIPKSKNYLIFTRHGININQYPAIQKYLRQFKKALMPKPRDWEEKEGKDGKKWEGRKPGNYKWYEIQDTIDYYKEFEKPKIIYPEISISGNFTLDLDRHYSETTSYILGLDEKWLLGYLNSKLYTFVFSRISSQIRGNFLRWKRQYMRTIPVPEPTSGSEKRAIFERLEQLVECMLELNRNLTKTPEGRGRAELEVQIAATDREIDHRVYELYDLTPDEIQIIESHFNKK